VGCHLHYSDFRFATLGFYLISRVGGYLTNRIPIIVLRQFVLVYRWMLNVQLDIDDEKSILPEMGIECRDGNESTKTNS
jgi:hypothetical protein